MANSWIQLAPKVLTNSTVSTNVLAQNSLHADFRDGLGLKRSEAYLCIAVEFKYRTRLARPILNKTLDACMILGFANLTLAAAIWAANPLSDVFGVKTDPP